MFDLPRFVVDCSRPRFVVDCSHCLSSCRGSMRFPIDQLPWQHDYPLDRSDVRHDLQMPRRFVSVSPRAAAACGACVLLRLLGFLGTMRGSLTISRKQRRFLFESIQAQSRLLDLTMFMPSFSVTFTRLRRPQRCRPVHGLPRGLVRFRHRRHRMHRVRGACVALSLCGGLCASLPALSLLLVSWQCCDVRLSALPPSHVRSS